MSDHLFASLRGYGGGDEQYGSLEPLSTLAALAPLTERVRLGTLVLSAGFRHPAIVAKSVTAIDRLSDGRVELGIGAGWFADEYLVRLRVRIGRERFAVLEETVGYPMCRSGTSRRRSRGSGSYSVWRTTTRGPCGSRGRRCSSGARVVRGCRGSPRGTPTVEHGLAVDARGVRGAGGGRALGV